MVGASCNSDEVSGINLLKTETMVSKNQATEAEGRGSRVFRDHSLGFKKV